MYGINAPQGLIPSRYRNNATWNGAFSIYTIQSGYATNLFRGDPVTFGGGFIVIGLAGAACLGAMTGCNYTTAAGQYVQSPYWPAGTVTLGGASAEAHVVDDPEVVFEIQTNYPLVAPVPPAPNVGGLPLPAAGKNANFIAGAGNPLTGNSGYMLDQGTFGPGNANYNLKILSLGDNIQNFPQGATAATTLAYNTALVLINNHIFRAGTAGM